MYEAGEMWINLGLDFEQAEARAVEIARKIAKVRAGAGDDEDDEEEDVD
jgi:hypothetical protein